MRRRARPPARGLTVGELETYLRDHDVPPDAEVRLRRAGAADTGGITLAWDPRALVLVLDEADPG